MFDWIVVGAGFTGATLAERIASARDEKVLVVDRRPHLAGNAYDEINETGIIVHKYGPHIFHTNSDAVWHYLQTFATWRTYYHRVMASIDQVQVPLPFNLNSIDRLFPEPVAGVYTEKLMGRFGPGGRVPVLKLMEETDPDLKALGQFVYDKVFRSYTFKQWGYVPEQLSPSVTARVPVLVDRDDRYFQDRYQAIPEGGYTALFRRMLNHRNIQVQLSTEYEAIRRSFPETRVVYTGPIDDYYGYRYGALPYRSIEFTFDTFAKERRQSVATVNYPNEERFTRITEMKHVTGQRHPFTTLIAEYPTAHVPRKNEPVYPIPREDTKAMHDRYVALSTSDDQVIFCGRLGHYRYYNMDQAVAAALAIFEKRINAAGVSNAT